MIDILISFGTLHLFVICGWFAKYSFKTQLHERSFVLLSMYFLQPLLVFWGILIRPIDWTLFFVPAFYLMALIIATIVVIPLRYTTTNTKDASILQITGLISNTGNLGIPFGFLIFGIASVPYTAMINLVNTLFIYVIGAYRYSRGQCSIRKSFFNVIKLPMIYSAALAIIWQWLEWPFPQFLMHPLEMAAYATMILQLMIFGMFIATIQRESIQIKNIAIVQLMKYALFPLIVMAIIRLTNLPDLAIKCLFLQSIMPIAVNNMNIAALYDCYPQKVALHAVISTLIAFVIISLYLS